MEHEDLKQIGITAYGYRHKLVKGMEKIVSKHGKYVNSFYCINVCLSYTNHGHFSIITEFK